MHVLLLAVDAMDAGVHVSFMAVDAMDTGVHVLLMHGESLVLYLNESPGRSTSSWRNCPSTANCSCCM